MKDCFQKTLVSQKIIKIFCGFGSDAAASFEGSEASASDVLRNDPICSKSRRTALA